MQNDNGVDGSGKEGGKGDDSGSRLNTGQLVGLGTNVAAGVGVMTFAGYYLDRKQGDGYVWTMCGLGVGLLYGAYEIWKVIRMLNLENNSNARSRNKEIGRAHV